MTAKQEWPIITDALWEASEAYRTHNWELHCLFESAYYIIKEFMEIGTRVDDWLLSEETSEKLKDVPGWAITLYSIMYDLQNGEYVIDELNLPPKPKSHDEWKAMLTRWIEQRPTPGGNAHLPEQKKSPAADTRD